MRTHKRVVITGLGAMTALGEGAQNLWEAVLSRRSGLDHFDWDESGWKPVVGRLKIFEAEKFITQRKAIKVMARDIQLAVAGGSLAIADSKLNLTTLSPGRIGVIVGSGVLNHELDELASSVRGSLNSRRELDLKKFGNEGLSALFPLWLLKYLPNMPACHLSILFNLQGPSNTIATGASAGLQAVEEAYRIIQRGKADCMLAGGAESKVNPVGLSQYEVLEVLAKKNGYSATENYAPFDRKASGLVIGEGAGFLLLEELEHAKKRGAFIHAEIAGFGSSSNDGRKVAIEAALEESKIKLDDLGFIQACGLGIPEEDILEAEAMNVLLNGSKSGLLVTGSKPITGYLGFAAGPVDLILSVLAMKHGKIPSLLNFDEAARPWKFDIVKTKAIEKKSEYAMTNAFGLGGQSVSAVLKTYRDSA